MLNSKKIAFIAIFSSLAFILMIMPLFYPFPPLPFLKFDIGEMPLAIISFTFDPISSFISSAIVGLLVVFREGDPIGALFKTLSLISTYVPLACLKKRFNLYVSSVLASLVRAIVMVVLNYILIPIIYLPGHTIEEIAGFFGLTVIEFLILIGIFNIIQGLINTIPAIYIYSRIPEEWKILVQEDVST